MEDKTKTKQYVKLIIIAAICILAIIKFDVIVRVIAAGINIAMPLITGALMAFVVNIFMSAFERHFTHMKRGVSMLLSYGLVIAIIIIMSMIIVPELINAATYVVQEIPKYYKLLQEWMKENYDRFPEIAEKIINKKIDWQEVFADAAMIITGGSEKTGVFDTTVNMLGTVFGQLVDLLISFFFSFYVLASKERILSQIKRLIVFFIPEKGSNIVISICRIVHDNYRNFIMGQMTEACLLGTLCCIGMLILRFPYAVMVGAFIGVTALIPILGAWLGAIAGAFMIFTVSPWKALAFIVYILILQQIDNNFIYPKIVGKSIGLPGVWVFSAVTIGAGLGGVAGMLFMLPTAASIYQILRAFIGNGNRTREGFQQALDQECNADIPLNPVVKLIKKAVKRDKKAEEK